MAFESDCLPPITLKFKKGVQGIETEEITSFKTLQAQEQEQQAYKSLNDEINRLKSLKGLEGDAALTTLVGLQATDQFAPEDFTFLQSLIDLHAEAHQALTHFLTDEELYKTFIIQTLALNQNWLSFIYSTHEKVTTSLDALALLNGLSVTVWGKTGADSLTPLHQTEAAPNATPRHILFTAAGKVGGVNPLQANHFNLLDTSPGILKTPVLSFEDVTSVDQSAYTSLGVSDISVVGAVAAFMEAERRTHDRRGVHRATVAPGYKIETDSNISGLNRDPARAFEITQDDSSHFWVGAPMVRDWNQAKAEAQKGADVIQQAISETWQGYAAQFKENLEEIDKFTPKESVVEGGGLESLSPEELAYLVAGLTVAHFNALMEQIGWEIPENHQEAQASELAQKLIESFKTKLQAGVSANVLIEQMYTYLQKFKFAPLQEEEKPIHLADGRGKALLGLFKTVGKIAKPSVKFIEKQSKKAYNTGLNLYKSIKLRRVNIDKYDWRKEFNIPKDWKQLPSDSQKGIKFQGPKNPKFNEVRIMEARPNSDYPGQRVRCVKIMKNGHYQDKFGNMVGKKDQAAHIPIEDFNVDIGKLWKAMK